MRKLPVLLPLILLLSCQIERSEVQHKTLEIEIPPHFPDPQYDFSDNPLTREGFELGRKLFYDVRLSRGSRVSCATCHKQENAFSDGGQPLSAGTHGSAGMRNAPGLYNLIWINEFMWDGGISHLELVALAPLTDSSEMDMSTQEVLSYLSNETEYPEDFRKAFGTKQITTERLLKAITQFQASLISGNSLFDKHLKGEYDFTSSQKRGYELFKSNCAGCHAGVLQSDFSYRNNGLDTTFSDPGRGRITWNKMDIGKFRVPSLRNLTLTAPYMHDGRFSTLKEVLDHYTEGILHSEGLDPLLKEEIHLLDQEKEDLLGFLETLTDTAFTEDPRFSDPFVP